MAQPWIGCDVMCWEHVFEWLHSVEKLYWNTCSVFFCRLDVRLWLFNRKPALPSPCWVLPCVMDAASPALPLCAGEFSSCRGKSQGKLKAVGGWGLPLIVSKEIFPLHLTTWCNPCAASHVRHICFGYKCNVIALRFSADLQSGLSHPTSLPQFWFMGSG